MRISLLTLLLLLAMPAAAAEDESDLFLVEVIVFTHSGTEPRLRPGEISDPGNAVDVESERERRREQPRDLSSRDELPEPEQYVAQNGLSGGMDGVWRRLRQSGEYRPLAWRGWYQHTARNQRTRSVLIHDDMPLREPGDMRFGREEYRLEGTLRYRRDRFHRLGMDIAWRQADGEEILVEHLTQRRSIRPGRLEYFDGPWLSALVLVTPWESPEEVVQ